MKTNLRQAAGSLLVVGLEGTELTGLERAWLKLVRTAGVILFRRNIADARQTRALLAEATSLCADNGFRCVDMEGGTVDRLRDALTAMHSAQAVAEAERRTGKAGLARRQGELIAQGVKAFGFNTTLAPVLDLALPESAQVMGTRSAAATAEGMVDYARDFLAGLAAHKVVGCGKHFPGLGGGALDSHLETPTIRRGMRGLSRDAGKEQTGERILLLDSDGSASADRLPGHYFLRRHGNGRHSEVHAPRRGCGGGGAGGNGPRGDLPLAGSNSARL